METKLAAELEQALGLLLLRRSRTRLMSAALELGPAGVDEANYPVLSGVARLGPISAARLAAEIGLDRSGTSRYADRLVEAGLLVRRRDPDDARATLLALTAAGRRAAAQLRAGLVAHLADLTSGCTRTQLRSLIDGMRLLADPG